MDIHRVRDDLLEELGGPGRGLEFTRAYAARMDDFLRGLFRDNVDQQAAVGLAVAALGGYGRGGLAPHSDVDLLFLTATSADQKRLKPLIEAILYPLWDSKLDVGQAVRTTDQCLEIARDDFATLSTQLDARFLAGDETLFENFRARLARWLGGKARRRTFYKNLKEMIAARHAKYGESPYLLEPNIKEGQGGLRDVHAILWGGAALYGVRTLEEISGQGLISRDRADEIEAARAFMTDVRVQVHRLAGRKTDALTFDLQEDVAGVLGFQDEGHVSSVERFMQEYYSHVYLTKTALDLFMSRVRDDLTSRRIWRMTQFPRRVEKGLEILRGQVELGSRRDVRERPLLMMRAFEVSAHSGLPISQRSLEIIRSNLDLVDNGYRRDPDVAASFFKAITALPPKSSRMPNNLDAMQILHFLGRYIPELASVQAQVQHDAYHVYTVDVHLVVTLWEMKKIGMGVSDPVTNGFERGVFEQVENKPMLFLAALLHDIGKGTGKDHARLGAEMVPAIAERLGLSDEDRDTLAFLIEEHLYIVHLAMRRDLTEEKLIVTCAHRVGNVDRLRMLYLLTAADSRATGPGVFNQWKASLLKDLYFKVERILTRSDLAGKVVAERTNRLLLEVTEDLEDRLPPEEVDRHLEKMSAHYLGVMNAAEVVRHIFLERRLVEEGLDLVWEVEEKEEGFCEVTVVTKDRPGLLSRMAGVFTLHHINILGAQVFTRANNIALDIFHVDHPPDRVYADEAWKRVREDAEAVLTGRLALDYRLSEKKPLLSLTGRTVTQVPDKVIVDNKTSDFYTIVEIHTYDRLGLLYSITQTLFDLQASIFVAKISTKVEQVVDVFYVKDFLGRKIEDEEQIRELKDALLFTLKR